MPIPSFFLDMTLENNLNKSTDVCVCVCVYDLHMCVSIGVYAHV